MATAHFRVSILLAPQAMYHGKLSILSPFNKSSDELCELKEKKEKKKGWFKLLRTQKKNQFGFLLCL